MKIIAFTIFTLVITETITGISIRAPGEKILESPVVHNDKANATEIKVHEMNTEISVFVPPPATPPTTTTTTTTTTTNTTTTTPKPTTTPPPPPPTTKSTTTSPSSSTTSTSPMPNPTTVAPPTPTQDPAHKTDRKFDSFSFIAGIVMAAGLMAIGLVAFKFYEARRDRNYHTI